MNLQLGTSRRRAGSARGVAFIGMALMLFAALSGRRGDAQSCPTAFSYSPGFASNSCLAFNGNASISGSLLQITPDSNGQLGSAWYTTAEPVSGSFSTTFTFQLPGGSADGFAFLIQNSSAGTSALGPAGCGMGFADDPLAGNGYFCGGETGGITNSVAIGFKTYNDDGLEYPPGNSVFIANNGTGPNCENVQGGEPGYSQYCVIAENTLTSTSITLGNGSTHTVTITYSLQPTAAQSACYAPASNAPLPCLDVILDGTDLFPTGVPFNMTSIGLTNNSAFVGFTGSTGGYAEGNDILSWTFTPQDFGAVNVCPSGATTPAPCSNTLPVTLSVPAGTTIGSVNVVTQGAAGLDFSLASAGTCTGTFATAGTCTANVTFTPRAPGLRMGAVELFGSAAVPAVRPLFGSAATPLATTLISGIGQGPAIAFSPAVQTILLPSGLSGVGNLAVDAAGDVFVTDYNSSQTLELTPGGGQTSIVTNGQGCQAGVAVDGAGDVFVSGTTCADDVEELTPGGVQTTVGSGFTSPQSLAVDGAGDVFIADAGSGLVDEVTPSGALSTVPASGLSNPYGVAVDGAGDVFIADLTGNKVVEVTPAGVQTTVGSGLKSPWAVAVDAAGDVFISDFGNGRVEEVTPGGVQTTVPVTDLGCPQGLAVDGAGDLFIADACKYPPQVVEVNSPQPPSLSFAATTQGSTSTNGPQTVSVQNIGNATLDLTAISFPLDFPQVGDENDCSIGATLTPGLVCPLTIDFKPTIEVPPLSTELSENVTLTDNALNATGATQSISVQGDALSPEVAVPAVVYDTLAVATTSITGSGLTLGTVTDLPSTVPIGEVVSESPSAGTLVTIPASVSLVISTGEAVPNVMNQTQSTAGSSITGVGLVVGTVTTQYSDTVPSGSVISQSPDPGTAVDGGTPVSLVVSSGVPPAADQLTLENNYFVTGDYATAGVTLRGSPSGNITIPSGSPCSPNCVPGGVPDGADIIDGFLYWTTIEPPGTSPSGNTGTFLGYSITGQQIGSDVPNYSDGTNTGTLRVYRADVNTYFPVPAGWSGARQGSGTFTVTLPNSGSPSSGGIITEGASLVVIYRVLSPLFPLKSVVIYDGSIAPTSLNAGPIPQALQGFYDAVNGPNGTGEVTHLYTSGGTWNNSESSPTLGQSNQYIDTLSPGNAYAAVILSTPVNNSDADGILDAWKAAQGYTDVKTGAWVPLTGATHGEKDLFVQFDYMCSAINSDNTCNFNQPNLYPSPDAQGNDPLAMVTQAYANIGVHLHLVPGNAILETTCTDSGTTPPQLCMFPNEPGVVTWDGSVQLSKVWPANYSACTDSPSAANCAPRFPYGQKDSYHYVLFGYSVAIPLWTTRSGSITSITVSGATANSGGSGSIVTTGLGTTCPTRITVTGVQGNPNLNSIYENLNCDSGLTTIYFSTPVGVPNWSYSSTTSNGLAEPAISVTSGTVTTMSGFSDLGGSDSVVSLGAWATAPAQDMSKSATVVAGTLFHEIGHTLGLTHGGLYFDTLGSYIPTFEANCKPNFQSSMNYLFQIDGLGSNAAIAYSNQVLFGETQDASPTRTILGGDSGTTNSTTIGTTTFTTIPFGSVFNLTDNVGNPASFSTSAWYTTTPPSSTASAATMHCDGSPLNNDTGYRVSGPVDSISPAWSPEQNITFDGAQYSDLRGYNDVTSFDLRQVGAASGELAALANEISYRNNGVFYGGSGGLSIGGSGGLSIGGSGGLSIGGSGGLSIGGSGGLSIGGSGGLSIGGSGGLSIGGSGGLSIGGSGGVQTEVDYLTANSIVRPPNSPTITPVMTGGVETSVIVDWTAPAFGVVQYYTVYRGCNLNGSDGVNIGVVNGVGGAAPATEFIDSNPTTCPGSSTVVYTIATTLNPVQIDPTQRSSAPSVPAIVKNLQTIVLGPLQSSVTYSTLAPTVSVTATAETNGSPNGLQVNFVATGPCSVSGQTVSQVVITAGVASGGVSTATVSVNDPGNSPATCTVSASQSGTNPTASSTPPYYDPANSVSESFTIEPASSTTQSQTITFLSLPNLQYGSTFSVSASSNSGLGVTFGAVGQCQVGTTTGTATVTTTGVGLCAITASQDGNGAYSPATVVQSFKITPAVLTVTAASPTITYGQPIPSLTPSLNVNYSVAGFVNSDSPSVVAGVPSLVGAALAGSSVGGYAIAISTGSLAAANYSFLFVNGTLTIQQASQTITFAQNAPPSAAYNGQFTVGATGGASGNPVVFTSAGSCSNSGTTTYTMTSGSGSCSVIAKQAGNTNYSAAQPVTQTVSATLATPTVTFTGAPVSAAYNGHFTVASTTNASTTPTITSSGACSNLGTAITMTSGTGNCSLSATWAADSNYNGATATQSTAASKIAPTVTFTGAPVSAAYKSSFTVATTTNASNTPTISSSGACSNLSTAITMTSGTGACSLTATWAADSNYNGATATQSTTANKIAPTVTFTGAPVSAAYNSHFTVATTTNASTTPTITSGGACSNSGTAITMTNGTGACSLTATWAADSNYNGSTATQSTAATLATATISISDISPTLLTGGIFTPTYSYAGNGAPKVTSSTTGVCTVSGTAVNLVGVGSCTLTASAPATSDYTAATGSVQSFTVVEAPTITSANNATFTMGTSGTFTVTATSYPAASIAESGALPNGITYVNNNNGTGTLSGKATVSGIYPITFTAQNGVGTAATQSFTLTSETTVPASSTTCNGVYIGTFSGNITVASGQNCIFEKGGATGNITENGGNLALSNATIGGNIQVGGGTYAIGPSTTIKGSLTIQSIPTGTAQNLICGTTVSGSLTVQSVGTAATIGSGSPSCPANTISGSLTLQANKAAVVVAGNTIKGSVTVQSSTAATTFTSNAISGSLTDQGNSAPSTLSLNTVTGTLVDQSNSASTIMSQNTVLVNMTVQGDTGPAQVTSNKVTGTLLCQSNTSITGSGDTAAKLQGQCASF